MDLLEDEFDFVRAAAIQLAAHIAQKRPNLHATIVDMLTACLFDDVAAVRAAALAALAAAAGRGTVPAEAAKVLRLTLDDGDLGVRSAAVMCASRHSCNDDAGMVALGQAWAAQCRALRPCLTHVRHTCAELRTH